MLEWPRLRPPPRAAAVACPAAPEAAGGLDHARRGRRGPGHLPGGGAPAGAARHAEGQDDRPPPGHRRPREGCPGAAGLAAAPPWRLDRRADGRGLATSFPRGNREQESCGRGRFVVVPVRPAGLPYFPGGLVAARVRSCPGVSRPGVPDLVPGALALF